MLGQSTTGEFALGQIGETASPVVVAPGGARFGVARTGRVVMRIRTLGDALFEVNTSGNIPVDISDRAGMTVEIF